MNHAETKAGPQGARIHYHLAGETGPTVLLIMGFSVRGQAWRHQIEGLRKSHRVIAFDNRGVGESDTPPGPYSMAQLAGDALGVLDHLGLADAHVVGLSMGGMIAQHLALRAPERVRSLSLIATHAGGLRARLPHWRGAIEFVRSQTRNREARSRAMARLLFPRAYLDTCEWATLQQVLIEDFGTPVPRASMLAQFAAIRGHATANELHRLAAVPTLIVRPDRDVLIQPRQSDRLHAGIPGSRLVAFEDCGHGVIRQRPGDVTAVLADHFSHSDAARGH